MRKERGRRRRRRRGGGEQWPNGETGIKGQESRVKGSDWNEKENTRKGQASRRKRRTRKRGDRKERTKGGIQGEDKQVELRRRGGGGERVRGTGGATWKGGRGGKGKGKGGEGVRYGRDPLCFMARFEYSANITPPFVSPGWNFGCRQHKGERESGRLKGGGGEQVTFFWCRPDLPATPP